MCSVLRMPREAVQEAWALLNDCYESPSVLSRGAVQLALASLSLSLLGRGDARLGASLEDVITKEFADLQQSIAETRDWQQRECCHDSS